MSNHVYCCAECGEIKIKAVVPVSNGCNNAPFHRWINAGIEGDKRYKCINCKMVVSTLKPPVSYGCGKHIFHDWQQIDSSDS